MLTTTDTILGPNPPRSAYVESYRVLRANVLAQHNREAFKTVLITSARPREGKTTVAINLATVLALAGKQTAMVDSDTEKQELSRVLEIGGTAGLTDLCGGGMERGAVVHDTGVGGLEAVSAGTRVEAASDLLIGSTMSDAIEQLSADRDFVVFDSTPILGFGESLTLAPILDIVFVVARARGDAGPVQQGLAAIEEVGANVGGVIVNDILPEDSVVTESYYQYYGGE